jgi:hypothetical protein
MNRIVSDASLPEKLARLENTVELCDPSGRVLGMFVPRIDPEEYEFLDPDVSEEELDRRQNSTERRYTTAEVLAHLKKLEGEGR